MNAFNTLVVDGAWLLPAWIAALRFEHVQPQMRAVYIHEADAEEVKLAMRSRSSTPETLPRQKLGALVSWMHGNRLRDEALAHGIPVIDARPRESLRRRVRQALGIEWAEAATKP